jgi:hypothetical protein
MLASICFGAYNILLAKLEERELLERSDLRGRKMLKWVFAYRAGL